MFQDRRYATRRFPFCCELFNIETHLYMFCFSGNSIQWPAVGVGGGGDARYVIRRRRGGRSVGCRRWPPRAGAAALMSTVTWQVFRYPEDRSQSLMFASAWTRGGVKPAPAPL